MDRNTYIGSSDARDVLSGDWNRLFQLKTGAIPPEDLSDNFKAQLGAYTEPFHLDWTIRRLSAERGASFQWAKTKEDGSQFFASFRPDTSEHAPFLGSRPDALLKSPGAHPVPIEVKHTGRFRSADEAADYYMPQLQHHLICWGVDQMLFSVICGTEEPERLWVGYSETWADYYLAQCDRFWGYVRKYIPPNPLLVQIKVPTAVKDSVPINGMKKRSLEGNNRAAALILEFIETQKFAKRHEDVKKELKGMMADDECELYHPALVVKRNKVGSILVTVKDDGYGQKGPAQ